MCLDNIGIRESEYVLGIDLGTTNSSVAIYKGGKIVEIPMDGNLSMPSAVRFKNRKKDSVVVGKLAKQYAVNIVAGSVSNVRNGKIYNTAMVFNRSGECVASCPQHTIELRVKNGKKIAHIRHSDCIRCYCCQELCPFEAIQVKKNLIIRIVGSI